MLTKDAIKKIGISQYGIISPTEIDFEADIQKICEKNCGLYGKSWACPPAVGTVLQCRERCLQFKQAMLFNAVYPLEDSFDYEGMMAGHKEFKKLCDRLYDFAKKQDTRFLLLSNEGCKRCKICTYPAEKCRIPEKLFPSIEGFGIHVAVLAEKAGILYNNGENTVTYFGMLLYG